MSDYAAANKNKASNRYGLDGEAVLLIGAIEVLFQVLVLYFLDLEEKEANALSVAMQPIFLLITRRLVYSRNSAKRLNRVIEEVEIELERTKMKLPED